MVGTWVLVDIVEPSNYPILRLSYLWILVYVKSSISLLLKFVLSNMVATRHIGLLSTEFQIISTKKNVKYLSNNYMLITCRNYILDKVINQIYY